MAFSCGTGGGLFGGGGGTGCSCLGGGGGCSCNGGGDGGAAAGEKSTVPAGIGGGDFFGTRAIKLSGVKQGYDYVVGIGSSICACGFWSGGGGNEVPASSSLQHMASSFLL